MQGLDLNKAYGHHNISIHMLKICSSTICKHFDKIFSQALTSDLFPSEWKKGNIIPIHKNRISKIYKTIAHFPCFLL